MLRSHLEAPIAWSIGSILTRHRKLELPAAGEEILLTAFDYAPFGALLLATGGRLLFASPVFYQMLGYAPDELVGLSLADLVSQEDRQSVEQQWARVTEGTSARLEIRCRRKCGDLIWAELSLRAQRDKSPSYRTSLNDGWPSRACARTRRSCASRSNTPRPA